MLAVMANPPPDLAKDWLGHQRWAARAADARTLVEEWFGRTPERAGMSEESLMKLQKQIEALKERGGRGEDVAERLLELRRTHYRETGAAGG